MMTYDDYDMMYERLMYLKKNQNNLSLNERTKNSLELTYRYYGYVRPITPAILNQVIDDVATRVQLENEYARTVHAPSPQDEKEDQLTLNELGQFEH